MDGPVLESPRQSLPVLEKGRHPPQGEQELGTCRQAPCITVPVMLASCQEETTTIMTNPTPLGVMTQTLDRCDSNP